MTNAWLQCAAEPQQPASPDTEVIVPYTERVRKWARFYRSLGWTYPTDTTTPARRSRPNPLRPDAATTSEDEDKIGLLEAACALYRGPIDESTKADWLLEHREGRLRAYRDAAGDLARIYSHGDPDRCLATLNALLDQDLLNEDLYRRIMRAQASLGRRDAVRRTLNLLDVRFETAGFEVDPSTYTLADQLTRRPTTR